MVDYEIRRYVRVGVIMYTIGSNSNYNDVELLLDLIEKIEF